MDSDLDAVARAYRAVCSAGGKDYPAFLAAMRAHRRNHPAAGSEASRIVWILIRKASVRGMLSPLSEAVRR